MRALLLSILVFGCTTVDSMLDGSVPDAPRGSDFSCPPIQINLSCRSTGPGVCRSVRAEGFELPSGCSAFGCPGSSVEGSCFCAEARNCVLDFDRCCGQCDEQPMLVSSPDFFATETAQACLEEECACDLERVVPFDQQVPVCVDNRCEARVIERACAGDEDCTLVHIPSGEDPCAQLDAISTSSESDFVAYHAESRACEVTVGAVARCDDSLVCVVDIPE
ncbi:MAG: hypothetical protein AB8H86_21525 [Polyangiales bacterium]